MDLATTAAAPARADGEGPAPFLDLRGVGLDFPGHPGTLDGIALSLAAGEVHCLVGRSGCGKTTLLRLAAGLVTPSRGQVAVQGRPPQAMRDAIGFVFQQPTLLEWLTARDNVLLPVSLRRRPTEADRARVDALLAQLGLDGLGGRHPRQLSGGQQSRVALARALMPGPRLLLLDEPFAALDALTREDLQQDLLAACGRSGATVLFVTHDIAEAVFLADRVTVMDRGRITARLEIALPRPRARALRGAPAFALEGARVRAALEAAP